MTMMTLSPSRTTSDTPGAVLGAELRDGLLQDLVAVGMLVNAARAMHRDATGDPRTDALLASASMTIAVDLDRVRSLIARLGLPD